MKKNQCTMNFLFFFLVLVFSSTICAGEIERPWNVNLLMEPPRVEWQEKGPIQSFIYECLPYHGKKASVFAYYANPDSISGKRSAGKKYPGIVLIHGAHGHAYREWVQLWAERGYAAISIDLLGNDLKREKSVQGGWETDYISFDWNYHAVTKIILAHSLLRGFTEVDKNNTAVTGISVGAQLLYIVVSLDKRFKAAVPVYGCGYLDEGAFGFIPEKLRALNSMNRDLSRRWVNMFDPSKYIACINTPLLFVTGSGDPQYPLDIFVKTYKHTKCPYNLSIIPNLDHNIQQGAILNQIYVFIDQYCRNGIPLPSIKDLRIKNGRIEADIQGKVRSCWASLHYTTDKTLYKNRKWHSINASIYGSTIKCPAPPENTTAWFLTLTDDRNATVSSKVYFN